jgi:hypothetical protein
MACRSVRAWSFRVSPTSPVGRWSGRQDSNLRPSGPKPDALPDCATPRHGQRLDFSSFGRVGAQPLARSERNDRSLADMPERNLLAERRCRSSRVRRSAHQAILREEAETWRSDRAGQRCASDRELRRPPLREEAHRLKSGCSIRSPALIPSLPVVPAFSSSTDRTGSPEGIVRVDKGSVFVATRAMLPSARMNSMSRAR